MGTSCRRPTHSVQKLRGEQCANSYGLPCFRSVIFVGDGIAGQQIKVEPLDAFLDSQLDDIYLSRTIVAEHEATPHIAKDVCLNDAILQFAIAVATLVKGYEIQAKVRPGILARYYTLGVALDTADLSAGKFDAWLLSDDFQTAKNSYAAGYTITAPT